MAHSTTLCTALSGSQHDLIGASHWCTSQCLLSPFLMCDGLRQVASIVTSHSIADCSVGVRSKQCGHRGAAASQGMGSVKSVKCVGRVCEMDGLSTGQQGGAEPSRRWQTHAPSFLGACLSTPLVFHVCCASTRCISTPHAIPALLLPHPPLIHRRCCSTPPSAAPTQQPPQPKKYPFGGLMPAASGYAPSKFILPQSANRNCWDFYDKGKLLGKGNFGKTYLAVHKTTRQEYAVKVWNGVSKCGGTGRADIGEGGPGRVVA